MTLIKAKDFATRTDLENKVRNLAGLTPTPKPDYQITGTRAELARLQLSDTNVFWGILCTITDDPTPVKAQKDIEAPSRGELHDSGINGQPKKQSNGKSN